MCYLAFIRMRRARFAPGLSHFINQALAGLPTGQAPRPPYTAPSTIRPILASPFLAILLPDAGGGGRVSQVAPGGTAAGGRHPILRS